MIHTSIHFFLVFYCVCCPFLIFDWISHKTTASDAQANWNIGELDCIAKPGVKCMELCHENKGVMGRSWHKQNLWCYSPSCRVVIGNSYTIRLMKPRNQNVSMGVRSLSVLPPSSYWRTRELNPPPKWGRGSNWEQLHLVFSFCFHSCFFFSLSAAFAWSTLFHSLLCCEMLLETNLKLLRFNSCEHRALHHVFFLLANRFVLHEQTLEPKFLFK